MSAAKRAEDMLWGGLCEPRTITIGCTGLSFSPVLSDTCGGNSCRLCFYFYWDLFSIVCAVSRQTEQNGECASAARRKPATNMERWATGGAGPNRLEIFTLQLSVRGLFKFVLAGRNIFVESFWWAWERRILVLTMPELYRSGEWKRNGKLHQ